MADVLDLTGEIAAAIDGAAERGHALVLGGVAVIIEVHTVNGFGADGAFSMQRDLS